MSSWNSSRQSDMGQESNVDTQIQEINLSDEEKSFHSFQYAIKRGDKAVLEQTKRERDELLSVCVAIKKWKENSNGPYDEIPDEIWSHLKNIINKIKNI